MKRIENAIVQNNHKAASYVRNFIFGVEDSLVSTVGLLSGVATAGVSRENIFITGIVLIFVEAISMAVGSFLSEYSAEEYEAQKAVNWTHSFGASAIMFISYFVSGFIPLAPYLVFGIKSAFVISIVVSLFALATLGIVGARMTRVSFIRNALRMLLLGGLAIAVGIGVGKLFV